VTPPHVTTVAPGLIANSTAQTITLTGTNFHANGSVFVNTDSAIATTWVSATQVTASVPAAYLTAVGTLTAVGYVNPTSTAAGACSEASPSNCDWPRRSRVGVTHQQQLRLDPIVAPVSVNPTVTSIAPTNLIANSTDQVITLTGTGFGADGSAFWGQDVPIATVWISATEATATVPADELDTPGFLMFVGYVNRVTGSLDWNNRSNMHNIPIQ